MTQIKRNNKQHCPNGQAEIFRWNFFYCNCSAANSKICGCNFVLKMSGDCVISNGFNYTKDWWENLSTQVSISCFLLSFIFLLKKFKIHNFKEAKLLFKISPHIYQFPSLPPLIKFSPTLLQCRKIFPPKIPNMCVVHQYRISISKSTLLTLEESSFESFQQKNEFLTWIWKVFSIENFQLDCSIFDGIMGFISEKFHEYL